MPLRYSTFDKKKPKQAPPGGKYDPKTQRAETQFARQLRKVAREVGRIVSAYKAFDLTSLMATQRALTMYAEIIKPWAVAVSKRMTEEVAVRDRKMWNSIAEDIGEGLKAEIASAPTGAALVKKMEESVHLITSIPTKAAQRVHRLTMEGMVDSTRASEIAKEILRTEDVTVSRANLIARTEVARTKSLLTQVRAEYIGSEGYIWRTAHDSDVRESHKKMEGKYVPWDTPPTLSDGTTTHAGQIYNCRCWPEPVIPNEFL